MLSAAAHPQNTPQVESLLASAQQARARSDFSSAAEFYRQAVKLRPEIPELRANLGLMYYQTGDDQEAIKTFHETIRLNPKLLVPNLFLGLEYVKLKRFKEAIPYLKRAAASNPKDLQAQVGLGQAYAGMGDTRRAVDSYFQATQLDTKTADVWYHLGITYLKQVEADARVLLTRHRDSSYLEALMGDNFAEQRALIQADEAYKKALAFPAFPSGTHASYGFVLLNRHDLVGAERELKSELTSNPGSLFAKLGMARLQVAQGATEIAAKEIEQIWNSDSDFLVSNAQRFTAGLPEAQRSELQRILEERKATANLSERLVGLFRSGATDEKSASGGAATDTPMISAGSPKNEARSGWEFYVTRRYRQCSELLSSRLPSLQAKELRVLAFCSYSTGEYRQAFVAAEKMAATVGLEAEGLYWEVKSSQRLAAQVLTRASEMDAGSPKLHVLLGDIYRQQKNFSEAEREYRSAQALQHDDGGALFGLALTLLANQKIDEALQLTQTALETHADDPEFNAVMGEILCAEHDFSSAEPYLKKGLKAKPEYVPHVRGLLARVYAQTDRATEAIAELKLALPDDKDGSLHFQIGRLYLKAGDRNSAIQAFEVSKRLQEQGLNRAAIGMHQGEEDLSSP